MFGNYIITALRNLRRNLGYSVITIFGFAIGLASFIIIFLYIKSELAYDREWKNTQRTYRITQSLNMSGKDDPFALTSFPVGPSLKEAVPGIETVVRFAMMRTQPIESGENLFSVSDVYATDPDFYKIFDYTFISGNPETSLSDPYTIILAQKEAIRIFGSTDIVDETLKINANNYKVTGVYNNQDHTTHFVPNALISVSSLSSQFVDALNSDWFRLISYTYILTQARINPEDLNRGIEEWVSKTIEPWLLEQDVAASTHFKIEALPGIHFNNSLQYDMPTNTSPKYIYIFGAIGIFILLIASINYMNLATAKSIRRAREIGVRKVSGANKKHIIFQFIGEAIIFSLLAMVIALALVELFTPVFNQLTAKNISLFHSSAGINLWISWLQVFGIVVLVGILSGSFPAFILSSFKPIEVLKGSSINVTTRNVVFSTAWIRKTLVVVQFTISVSMLIGTLVVFEQLQFMRNGNLGFNKENVLIINMPPDTSLATKKENFKNELLNYSGISKVSATNNLPGYNHGRLLFFVDDEGQWINHTMNVFVVDDDYKDLLELELDQGRFFSKDYANDDTAAFVINEAAAKFLNLEAPLGHQMQCGLDVNGRIVGVLKDFHYASLQNPIEPLVLVYKPDWLTRLAVKIKPENLGASMQFIEDKWMAFDQKHPYSYSFLDTNFDLQYDRERKLLSIFGYFAILIIIISSMGLLGLASFTAEQRTKEIGIRKVFGSSEKQITMQLIKEFLSMVILAGIFAIIISYLLMEKWLEEFAQRISLDWTFGFYALLIALFLAISTVIFQALRAARANPVDVLKYE